MKKITIFVLVLMISVFSLMGIFHPKVNAAFNQNQLIGDNTFSDSNSMSSASIDAFLNQFGNSCISTNSGFAAILPTGYSPAGGFTYGGYSTAGQVIAAAAQVYGINPKVLIVTLQKEQSLVTGGVNFCNNGDNNKYAAAVGYGCPDSGTTYSYSGVSLYRRNGVVVSTVGPTCVNSAAKAGFSQQVIRAAWLLRFGQQRSLGNTGWAVITGSWDNSDDLTTCYAGPMTQGSFSRCRGNAPTFFDGYTTIDGTAVHMNSGATAALYWYTPHFNGNQNFYNIYTGWFGDPNSGCPNASNVTGATSGSKLMTYKIGGAPRLTFTQLNNTGSGCTELHSMNAGFQSWLLHSATAMNATDPATGTIVALQSPIDNQEGLVNVLYSGSNGNVEIHRMSPNLLNFPGYYDVPTNLGGVTPTTGKFVSGDYLGRGYQQLAYVLFSNGTGHVEVHLFDPSLRTAVGYYDVATNLSNVSSTTGTFVSGDFLGRGYDQLAYVLYSNGTGHAEVHLFDPSLRTAVGYYDVVTNLTNVSATNSSFVSGNYLGRTYDQLIYGIDSNGTGQVETHMFNPQLTLATGYQDIVTTLGGFNPTL